METLLHPDFVEFGRSGARYTRADILKRIRPRLRASRPSIPGILAAWLSWRKRVALLTYTSAHIERREGETHTDLP